MSDKINLTQVEEDFKQAYTHFRKLYLDSIFKITDDNKTISSTTLISSAFAALLDIIADANYASVKELNKHTVNMDAVLTHFFLVLKNTPELDSTLFKSVLDKIDIIPVSSADLDYKINTKPVKSDLN